MLSNSLVSASARIAERDRQVAKLRKRQQELETWLQPVKSAAKSRQRLTPDVAAKLPSFEVELESVNRQLRKLVLGEKSVVTAMPSADALALRTARAKQRLVRTGATKSVPFTPDEAVALSLNRQERADRKTTLEAQMKAVREQARRDEESQYIGEPGALESLIPFWGSLRQGINDFQHERYGWALANALLAASDAFYIGSAAKLIGKTGKLTIGLLRHALSDPKVIRVMRSEKFREALAKNLLKIEGDRPLTSTAWKTVRQKINEYGISEFKGQHFHHWLIPRNAKYGKYFPEWFKNMPWNLMPLPEEAAGRTMRNFHNAIEGKRNFMIGSTERNIMPLAERLWYGTPHRAKAYLTSTIGHSALLPNSNGPLINGGPLIRIGKDMLNSDPRVQLIRYLVGKR